MMESLRTQDKDRSDRNPADLLEPGNILRSASGAFAAASPSNAEVDSKCYPVAIVGAGQAGLSLSYHLARRGIDHIVLEAAPRVGDVWRNRWDSLRLFTPAKFDGLDGYPFPAGKDDFPTKNEMADYLESYAARFQLPVCLGTRVIRLAKTSGEYRLETTTGIIKAKQAVVAAAGYRQPHIPDIADEVGKDVFQMHSCDYRNSRQIPDGPVLLVGAGNSGAEIAMDLAKSHEVTLAGRDVGHVPFDIAGFWGRKFLVRFVVRGLFHHLLTMRTPMGRRFQAKMHGRGMPLIRTRPGQLERAGVRRVGRIKRIDGNRATAIDGDTVVFASVIWCTGYSPGFDWVDLPVLDEAGHPSHRHGVATNVEGLYFLGLNFQYAVSSTMVAGVGRDARRIARRLASVKSR